MSINEFREDISDLKIKANANVNSLKTKYDQYIFEKQRLKLAEKAAADHLALEREKARLAKEQELRKYKLSPEDQAILDRRKAELHRKSEERKKKALAIYRAVAKQAKSTGSHLAYAGIQTAKLATVIPGRPDIYQRFQRDYRVLNPYSKKNPYRRRRSR